MKPLSLVFTGDFGEAIPNSCGVSNNECDCASKSECRKHVKGRIVFDDVAVDPDRWHPASTVRCSDGNMMEWAPQMLRAEGDLLEECPRFYKVFHLRNLLAGGVVYIDRLLRKN